jgi:hypothetical protein
LPHIATEPLILYPKAPRPSYADQVLELLRGHDLRPPLIHEVKELQTALGLVAAETSLCLVPASVEQLKRKSVVYRPINDPAAMSPIIMSTRKGDHSSFFEPSATGLGLRSMIPGRQQGFELGKRLGIGRCSGAPYRSANCRFLSGGNTCARAWERNRTR